MTVEELIEELLAMPQDLEVELLIATDWNHTSDVLSVRQKDGKVILS